jgi:ribosomal protein S27AE
MAIFRVTSRTWTRPAAKATVRYIAHAHRREKEGTGRPRQLFGRDGEALTKCEAYRMIDQARGDTTFFRLVISPNRKTEDQDKRLDLKTLTENTMMQLQDRFPNQNISYIAAVHTNTDNRHVHILALIRAKRIPQQDLRALISTATNEARVQRQELDGGISLSSTSPTTAVAARRTEPQRAAKAGHSRYWEFSTLKKESQARPIRMGPSCPNCGPSHEMERRGRRFECPSCGLRLRQTGLGIEIIRSPVLELSLEGVGET